MKNDIQIKYDTGEKLTIDEIKILLINWLSDAEKSKEVEAAKLRLQGKFAEAYELETMKGNALLIKYKYKGAYLATIKQWNEKGYKVKRGERAKYLWGSPIKYYTKDGEIIQKQSKDVSVEEDFKFFPVAFVFSADQVEQIEKFEEVKEKEETAEKSEEEEKKEYLNL